MPVSLANEVGWISAAPSGRLRGRLPDGGVNALSGLRSPPLIFDLNGLTDQHHAKRCLAFYCSAVASWDG